MRIWSKNITQAPFFHHHDTLSDTAFFFAVFLCIIRLFRNFAEVNIYLLLRDAVRNRL